MLVDIINAADHGWLVDEWWSRSQRYEICENGWFQSVSPPLVCM